MQKLKVVQISQYLLLAVVVSQKKSSLLRLYKSFGSIVQVNIDFEPFKPINTSLYLCDNKFHTEALTALLADDNRFGFIVMDGNGALFGTLQVIKVYINVKVIYPKYSKHWTYTLAHTIDCVCSKMLNRGLHHGLFLSLFKFFGWKYILNSG